MYFICKKSQSFHLCLLAFSIKHYTVFKYKHSRVTHKNISGKSFKKDIQISKLTFAKVVYRTCYRTS